MEQFITWEILTTYATFISVVYMVVEFTKELKGVKKIPTKYWSFIVSFILLITVNAVMGTFKLVDLVLYALSSIAISLGANGLSNFNS